MIWTSEKPTRPGWYWWRSPMYAPSPQRIELNGPDEPYCATMEEDNLDELGGEWAGPILEPDEQA